MSRVRVVGIWHHKKPMILSGWRLGKDILVAGVLLEFSLVGTLMNTFVIICCTSFDVF